MSEEQKERDWSEVPPELLHVIAKLPDLPDFIRFRAVCDTWRLAAPLSDPPHHLPWLLELFGRDYQLPGQAVIRLIKYHGLRKRQRFHSLSSGETLIIPFRNKTPELRTFVKRRGLHIGYLPFHERSSTLSFFNPLTRDLFSRGKYFLPWMVWTGTDPICNRTIIVGDSKETKVENAGDIFPCCYWHGMLFSTSNCKTTRVFDAQSKELLREIPPPDIESKKIWFDEDGIHIAHFIMASFLVVSSGVILRVVRHRKYGYKKPIGELGFSVYRLDFERANEKSCWVQIDNIGNQILFLDKTNGFSATARPSAGFREGCIYFVDYYKDERPYMYDILAGTVERVPCPFENCTWFLPSL
ncbi:hypothetical protein LUZ63_009446 [Rhynchospora breviuscula]|uniref:KIB1-4 beta-propeller domain-containing protein n=1 Tax=Rhynchospora breviuscula TaxID=2022672 RepID=A0A9Q0CF58_9POAL|nr:hypothetical protein LUZ63_009446 [Rhynchospora breviuscula]